MEHAQTMRKGPANDLCHPSPACTKANNHGDQAGSKSSHGGSDVRPRGRNGEPPLSQLRAGGRRSLAMEVRHLLEPRLATKEGQEPVVLLLLRVARKVEHGSVFQTRRGPLDPAVLLVFQELAGRCADASRGHVVSTAVCVLHCLWDTELSHVLAARTPMRGHADHGLELAVVGAATVLLTDRLEQLPRRGVGRAEQAALAVVEDVDEGGEAPRGVLIGAAKARDACEHNYIEGLADCNVIVGADCSYAKFRVRELRCAHVAIKPRAAAWQHPPHRHRNVIRSWHFVATEDQGQRRGELRVRHGPQRPEEAAVATRRGERRRPRGAEVLAGHKADGVAMIEDGVDKGLEDFAIDTRRIELVGREVGRRHDRAAGLEEPLEKGAHEKRVADVEHVAFVEAQQR
mmetsp:Transcript_76073/g.211473  ORF Transcript_76073/g.211473 Transcript_76073/m.211473 type:complete len:402 (-) Transcript_76073:500-1705(-)